MDFASPLMAGLLGRMAAGLQHYQVVVEERLPDRDGLARHDGEAYATELVVQLYFPGGTASEPAAALADAVPEAV
jgi:hypothetical protein